MRLREFMEQNQDNVMYRQDPDGDIDLITMYGPEGTPPEEYFNADWLDQEVEIIPMEHVVYIKVASGEGYVVEDYVG